MSEQFAMVWFNFRLRIQILLPVSDQIMLIYIYNSIPFSDQFDSIKKYVVCRIRKRQFNAFKVLMTQFEIEYSLELNKMA